MSDWKEVIIGDHIDLLSGYAFKSKDFLSNKTEIALPVIKIKNVANGDVNLSDVVYHDCDQKLEKYVLSYGDILITMTGNHPDSQTQVVGNVSRYKLPERALLNQRVGKLVGKGKTCLPFIYYLFKTVDVRDCLASKSSGSANQANISKTDILELFLRIPPPIEQRQIAEVLSSLDDKIDLLQRQNETLEQMAEALFRQWFVEEAEDSWEEGVLSDLVTVKYGKDHKKLQDGCVPAYGSGGLMRYVNVSLYDQESVLVPRKGTLQNVMYVDEPFWTVDTMFYTVMKKSNVAKFVFHYLKLQDLASMNVGSAVPSMTTEILNNLPISIPPHEVLDKFEDLTSTLYKKKKSNTIQISKLENTRDTLLPKLMNGSLTVTY